MKTTLCSAICMTLIGASALAAQPSFTKITEGPLVNDLGVMPICPAWGDLNNDGYLDLMIVDDGRWAATNDFTRTVQMVYLNNADGTFRRATEADVGPLATRAVALLGPMRLADYDDDGYLDVYIYEGLDPAPEEVAYLYRGGPDGKFTLVGEDVGINRPLGPWLPAGYYPVPWGRSWVDYDQDGHLDIFLTTAWVLTDTVDQLWCNQGNGTFSRVLVKLVGTLSNRSAIGAKVRVQATIWGQDVRQMREISGTPWTGDPRAHFVLGDATVVDTIRIEWPSGIVQELTDVAANRILPVTEPARLVPQVAGGFQIQSWINQAFDVQSSGDLVTWTTAASVTNQTGTLVFQDTVTGGHKCRYYRVSAE